MKTDTKRIPTLEDIKAARERISKDILKTPLRHYANLSKQLGCEVYLKFENTNPTCAFKVRGGVNLAYKLKEQGSLENLTFIAGSTGNHGQSVAYAGKLLNIPTIIAVPEGANLVKVKAMEELGATVVFKGKDTFDTWNWCKEEAGKKGYKYILSCEEPDLFEGVGTIGLEVFEDVPDLDCYITAVGGGSGICGASIALKSLNPKIKTYAVQAEGASSVHDSFKKNECITYPSINTFAEGLATRSTDNYPLNIMQKYVDDMFLVSDDEIKRTIKLIFEHTRNVAEGAGAASLAGLIKNKELFRGKKVVCCITGGNLQVEVLKEILNNY